MPSSSRSVLYDLLYSAIIEIRGSSGGVMSAADSQLVFDLSYLVHNWPHQMRDAISDGDHDELLRKFWRERHRPSDPWMSERLTFLGVLPESLE